jgi:AsmA protein
MKKPFKILALIVGGLLALMVVAAIALPMFFDPNNYRAKASDYVKTEYGRKLEIGDVKLSVFPWLRVKLSNVTMDNAQGFGADNFAEVGVLSVGVKLLPLVLDRKVEASAIELDGLKLHLAKNAQGQTNWDDFLKPKDDKDSKDKNKDSEGFKLASINISGISLKDATLSYRDAQKGKQVAIDKLSLETGAIDLAKTLIDGAKVKLASLQYSDATSKKNYVIENLTLKTGTLKPGKSADLDLAVTLNSSAPQARIELKLGGSVLADLEAKTYTVKGLALNTDLSGAAVPGGKQNVKLDGDLFFDQGKGAARFSKAKLEAAGLTLMTDINASGLNGDNARLAGPITIAPFSPREVMSKLGMKASEASDKTALTSASFSAQYNGSFKDANLSNIALKLDQTNIVGTLAVTDLATQAIEFALKGDNLDADRYMSPKAAKAGETVGSGGNAQKKSNINEIKLPTEALDKLNVNGTLTFVTLKLSGLKLSDVSLRLAGSKNSPKTQQLSAKLYGGQIATNTRVGGGGTPSYGLKTSLQSLNAGPFLTDFMGKDFVTGLGNLTVDLTGTGDTVGDLRRTLNGDLAFKLQNGAVKGFNLAQIIRNGQAMLNGQAASMSNEAKQTDFTAFSASAKIINGILHSDALDASSPLFRLAGAGQIDLVNETINYTAKPTIVSSAEGQGGKGLDALRGITVPIRLSGSMYAPKYELALDDVLKEKATAKLTELVQQKLGGNNNTTDNGAAPDSNQAIGNALMGLFGKKQEPAQPAPAQPAPTP